MLRVTDHKTGRKPDRIEKVIIGGGAVLQPVLYAMAVEAALGRPVTTAACSTARRPAASTSIRFRSTRRRAPPGSRCCRSSIAPIETGFLAATPTEEACGRCDFRPVCGPDVFRRVAAKPQDRLADLAGAEEPAMTPAASRSDEESRRAHSRGASTRRSSSRPRPAPARRPSWSSGSCASSPTGRADVRGIVAVTFTEKAAGELKLRLRQGLEEERRDAVDRRGRRRGWTTPSRTSRRRTSARSTASAPTCCASGRSKRAIDPLFRVLTEGQAERLFDEAFDGWFQAQLEDPPEGVRRSLRRASRGFRPGDVDEDGPIERLRRAGFDLTEWRDFRGAVDARAVRSRGARSHASIELVHALRRRSRRTPSYAGDNLFARHRARPPPEPRICARRRRRTPTPTWTASNRSSIELRRNRDFKRARKGSGPTYAQGRDARAGARRRATR